MRTHPQIDEWFNPTNKEVSSSAISSLYMHAIVLSLLSFGTTLINNKYLNNV